MKDSNTLTYFLDLSVIHVDYLKGICFPNSNIREGVKKVPGHWLIEATEMVSLAGPAKDCRGLAWDKQLQWMNWTATARRPPTPPTSRTPWPGRWQNPVTQLGKLFKSNSSWWPSMIDKVFGVGVHLRKSYFCVNVHNL